MEMNFDRVELPALLEDELLPSSTNNTHGGRRGFAARPKEFPTPELLHAAQ